MDVGVKFARVRKCRWCEWRRSAASSVWQWPRCMNLGATGIDLDDAFMEGPETNCPGGLWTGLPPLNIAQEDFEGRIKGIVIQRLVRKPLALRLIKASIAAVGLPTVRTWIKNGIGAKECPMWIMVEIARELGQQAGSGVPANGYLTVANDGTDAILAAWGNDPAYYALRDSVESGALTQVEAQAIATAKAITEPIGV